MEKLTSYLTLDGWKRDWEKTNSNLREGLTSFGVSGLMTLPILTLSILMGPREINSIGAYDFNEDGVKDPIEIRLGPGGHTYEVSYMDGNNVFRDNEGTLRQKGFALPQSLRMPPIGAHPYRAARTALVRDIDGNGSLDLELYTSIDVEPGSKVDTYMDVR